MSLLELFCQPEMESLIRKKVPDVHKMVFYNMPRSTCKILILLQKLVPFCYVFILKVICLFFQRVRLCNFIMNLYT